MSEANIYFIALKNSAHNFCCELITFDLESLEPFFEEKIYYIKTNQFC